MISWYCLSLSIENKGDSKRINNLFNRWWNSLGNRHNDITSPETCPPPISFASCNIESLSPLNTNSPSPSSQHPPSYFLPMNLAPPGILCKWDHTVFVLGQLAHFTQHNVLKVHPCYGRCRNLHPCSGGILFHCVEGPHCIYPPCSTIHWHLACFHPLATE